MALKIILVISLVVKLANRQKLCCLIFLITLTARQIF
ncbi:MAG: hypothetical protein UV04_C0044G0005 [Candidatus Gottesmanbacteria bacterium GW2011_GWA2_42_16]|nr:MAG: hypothetical protein UV04_C0044G0005 [Candidatus Gottesmanbacteria bacterium GW2011_GWA2_42_16]